MLTGRSFVGHIVFSIDETGAPVNIRANFRVTVTHEDDGIYEVNLTDDTANADAVPHLSASPNGGVAGGKFVGQNWLRISAKTYRIYTYPAATQLDAGPPAVFGFPAAGATADPGDGTILAFTLDRVDTV